METIMSDLTLDELKNQAKALGIKFSPNIGAEALQQKIKEATEEAIPVEDVKEAPTVNNDLPSNDPVLAAARLRKKAREEALKLVRCKIVNNDPNKNDLQGDYYTVANSVIGKVTKYVPFRGTAAESWHIPMCIYNFLTTKKFVNISGTSKDKDLSDESRARELPEFSITILPPLTKEELAELAKEQAAGNRID